LREAPKHRGAQYRFCDQPLNLIDRLTAKTEKIDICGALRATTTTGGALNFAWFRAINARTRKTVCYTRAAVRFYNELRFVC
jgi:hypothetical protein